MLIAQSSYDHRSAYIIKQDTSRLYSCAWNDSFDVFMLKLMSLLRICYFNPIFLDYVIDPKISINLSFFSLPSEDENVVIETNLNMAESRTWRVSFFRACIDPFFGLFFKLHDVV